MPIAGGERRASAQKPFVALPTGENAKRIFKILKESRVTTICQEGRCPNIGICWGKLHATFMVLGDICTRNCRFCSVKSGKPEPLTQEDWEGAEHLAKSIRDMKLRYAVITMVTRDDLPDGGASYLAHTVRMIRKHSPNTYVELLVSDLGGEKENLETLLREGPPDVFAHNLETVKRLTPLIRDRRASYERSLKVLSWALELTDGRIITKSGIIVGMGETLDEVVEAMRDLREVGVKAITIGQYYRPSKLSIPVAKYYTQEEFKYLEEKAKEMGFIFVKVGARVRSSFGADEIVTYFRRAKLMPGYMDTFLGGSS